MKKFLSYVAMVGFILFLPLISLYATEMKVVFINSEQEPIQNGHVKYFDNTWKNFGLTDENGEVTKELPDGFYDFRMIYEGITYDQVNINTSEQNPLYFSTVHMQIHFKNSQGAGLPGGLISYFGLGWTSLGETDAAGNVFVEILPGEVTFRIKWEGRTIEESDFTIDPLMPYLEFQTVKMVVKLISSEGTGLGGGEVEFRSPGWTYFGTTNVPGGGGHAPAGGGGCGTGGGTNKELLPGNYDFRMTYEDRTITMEDVNTNENNPLVFETLKMVIKLKTSTGEGIAGALVEFNSSGWKFFGTTKNPGGGSPGGGGGCGSHEEGDHEPGGCSGGGGSGGSGGSGGGGCGGSGSGGSGGSGGGGCGGSGGSGGGGCGGGTGGSGGGGCSGGNGGGSNGGGPGGVAHKELLPGNYAFRVTWEGATETRTNINIAEQSPLLFFTVKTIIRLEDSYMNGLAGGIVTFFSDMWREGGVTDENGEVWLELLSFDYGFNMEYAGMNLTKQLTVEPPESLLLYKWDGESLKQYKPEEDEGIISLTSVYPNPTRGDLNINFNLEMEGMLDLAVIDLNGAIVRQLYKGLALEGPCKFHWDFGSHDGASLGSGFYFCRIISGNTIKMERILLIK